MANFGFDTAEYESSGGDYEVMPKGEYTLKATDCEMKKTKNGDGAYLAVTFEVVKGSFAGRKVWQNFNIHNPSDKAQKIGREQVAGWARACGKPNANDSDQLLERQFNCRLDIEKGTGGYSDKNIIKAFLSEGESSKASGDTPKKSKFDDEPAPKREEPKDEPKREEPRREEPKDEPKQDEPPKSAKKNPWD